MTGQRPRLGVIVPSSNTAVEDEFPTVVPPQVGFHVARIPLTAVTADALDTMSDHAVQAATALSHADVDVVAYACTTGSLLHGPGFDVQLETKLSEAADAPAVATARSVVRALAAINADRIAVVTPYVEDLNDRERDYLAAAGLTVVTIDGRGITANTEIGALRPEEAYEQAQTTADGQSIDAVFISCTNYRTLSIVDTLEADLNIPVVTSNLATLWDLSRAGTVAVDGPGTLFDIGGPS